MDPHTTLADLAALGPAPRGVLLRHQLDFCCGGHQTLAAACARAGLAVEPVLAELERALAETSTPPEDWASRPLPDLVAYIVERFHRPLPAQLDAVVAAAQKVERVHAAKPACPAGLAAHLQQVRAELLEHLAKEEQVLFPAIVAGRRGPMLTGPIGVMTHEHDDHGHNLARVRALTNGLVAPSEACATWRALYEQLTALEAELMEHIHLENHLLFPRALRAHPGGHAA